MLFVSGQVKRPDRAFDSNNKPLGVRQVGVQEVDIVSIIGSITKYAVTVLEPNDIRYHLEKATYLARSGRPGPVWIDIPLDVQAYPIDDPHVTRLRSGFPPHDAHIKPAELNLKVDEILKLNRLNAHFLHRRGVRLARGEPAWERPCARRCPRGGHLACVDLMADDDPLCVGRPGTIAQRGALRTRIVTSFLSIGARLDRVVTGYAPGALERRAKYG
jgi:acetolactate synthase-1/2/3 large subunit